MLGMILEYVSTSSNYSAVTGLGSVTMATQYDANAPPLPDLLAVKNCEFSTTSRPDQSFIHPIECASEVSPTTVRFIRTQNTSEETTSDDRLDDLGLFQYVVQGGPTAANGVQIGELWVMYDIELLKPILPDIHVGTSFVSQCHYPGGTSGSTVPFVPNTGNSLACVLDGGTPGSPPLSQGYRLVMPAEYNGQYLLIAGTNIADGSSPVGATLISAYGSEITPIGILPQVGTGVLTSQVYSGLGSGQLTAIALFAFSTIAETGSPTAITGTQNYIDISDVYYSGSNNIAKFVLVLPLDNDISNTLTSILGFRGRFNPAGSQAVLTSFQEELAALRSQLQARPCLLAPGPGPASTSAPPPAPVPSVSPVREEAGSESVSDDDDDLDDVPLNHQCAVGLCVQPYCANPLVGPGKPIPAVHYCDSLDCLQPQCANYQPWIPPAARSGLRKLLTQRARKLGGHVPPPPQPVQTTWFKAGLPEAPAAHL
jgi:hypothetical protein